MKKMKKLISLVLAFIMVFASNISVFANKSNDNFRILKGEYDNEIIVIENEKKSIIKYGYDNGKFKTYLYDDNNTLIKVYEDLSEEIDMESSNFFNNIGESIYRSGGDGSYSNPYKYCTPGSSRINSSNISYSQIIAMVGLAPSLASVTAAVIVLIKSGIGAVVSGLAIKEVVEFIVDIIKSHSSEWLDKHGINLRIRSVCTLQNYKDGAWNEDIWFYGESATVSSYSQY